MMKLECKLYMTSPFILEQNHGTYCTSAVGLTQVWSVLAMKPDVMLIGHSRWFVLSLLNIWVIHWTDARSEFDLSSAAVLFHGTTIWNLWIALTKTNLRRPIIGICCDLQLSYLAFSGKDDVPWRCCDSKLWTFGILEWTARLVFAKFFFTDSFHLCRITNRTRFDSILT